ncbi:MAG: hypothetical protein VKO65_09625 [Cyanobacteriota bacterium]|nr:hypothetical protein [Cyanobacteriota bacterium]
MSGRHLVLLVLACSHLSAARAFTWEDSRDYGLGDGRKVTLQSCEQGRDVNARKLSYFGTSARAIDELVRRGTMTREQAEASARGQQAAMKVLCPEVW